VTVTGHPTALAALLDRLRAASRAEGPLEGARFGSGWGWSSELDPMLEEFLRSLMVWEASESLAAGALGRIHEGVVDCNELRVLLPGELAELIGKDYPRSQERASRLRDALNSVYRSEDRVSMERLSEAGPREARSFMASLEGTPGFVASRCLLLTRDIHLFPVDDRIVAALHREGVLGAGVSVQTAEAWLEKNVRAAQTREAYLLLEDWVGSGEGVA
jgi:hypothetical protein